MEKTIQVNTKFCEKGLKDRVIIKKRKEYEKIFFSSFVLHKSIHVLPLAFQPPNTEKAISSIMQKMYYFKSALNHKTLFFDE